MSLRPRVWRVDSRPTGNIARNDGVGGAREPARDTPKGGLVRTIALSDQATGRTRPRRIARVHQDHGHACEFRLVFNKRPQLMKSPTVLATLLSLTNRDPVANARQVFQSDPAPRVLGCRHQLFGNTMIFVCGKASFLATALFEQAFGRLRAFFLQPLAQFCMTLAEAVDGV